MRPRQSPVAAAALGASLVALLGVGANFWLDVRGARESRDARVSDLLDDASDLLESGDPDDETGYERRQLLGGSRASEIDREALGRARRLIERALEIDPDNAAARSFRALVDPSDEGGGARIGPAEWKALPGRFASAYYHLGNGYLRMQRPDKAAEAYRRAVAIDPGLVNGYIGLGNALVGQGRVEDAIEAYWEALHLAPDSPYAHHGLGLALHRKGRLEGALAEYRKAVELAPDYPVAQDDLADLLFETGQMKEAAKHYRRAIELAPRFASPHRGLAGALAALGHVEESAESLERANALEPQLASARAPAPAR